MLDFNTNNEKIDLTAVAGLTDFTDVTDAATQDGPKVVLAFAEGDLTLEHTLLTDLTADNFVL